MENSKFWIIQKHCGRRKKNKTSYKGDLNWTVGTVKRDVRGKIGLENFVVGTSPRCIANLSSTTKAAL